MIKFHAVLTDETGCEFVVYLEAIDHFVAYDQLADDYPESQVVNLQAQRNYRAFSTGFSDGSF